MTVLSDVELIECARGGDQAALAELYLRHRGVARRVASTACRHGDPDDLVNEAFEKVFAAVQRQAGPTDAFRAYLFVTIRRLAARQSARNRDEPYEEIPEPVIDVADGPGLDPTEREMITWAFSTLPDRWQAVLWHTAVEGRHPREVASTLGMSSNAVSALAYRAREKLRQAYLQAHLQAAPRPECEPHRSSLGAYVRNGLGKREQTTVRRHLDGCRACQALLAELDDVNHLLARAVAPLFLATAEIGSAIGTSAGESVSAATGASAGGADAASTALDASSNTVSTLADGAARGGRHLLELLPETTYLSRAAGRVAAAAVVLAALGGSGYLVLENAPEPSRPGNAVVADEGEPTTVGTDSPTTETVKVERAQGCLPEPNNGGSASSAAGSETNAQGESPDTELEALGVDVTATLALHVERVTAPGGTIGHTIKDVACDTSDGEGDLLVTIADEEAPEPTQTPETQPSVAVETGDLVPDVLPSIVPDVDVGLTLELGDGTHLELETNLNELCKVEQDGGNLVCELDDALGNLITETLSQTLDATEADLTVNGLGGETVLSVELKEGDLVLDAKVLELLP